MPHRRIASLVPAATETLFALGAGERVVAVSHACDRPPEATERPRASRTRLRASGSGTAIDTAVRQAVEAGEPLHEVGQSVLHHVRPDLVVVQDACHVCGVSPPDVKAAFLRYEPEEPDVLALHPHTLDDVLETVATLGEAAGAVEQARAMRHDLEARIRAVEGRAAQREARPRVAVLDWVDPPMAAGHWVPDLVARAGGRPVLAGQGEPSRYVDWDEVRAAEPGVIVLSPCGLDVDEARREARSLAARDGWEELPAVKDGRVHLMDGGAYLSRPGPRLVDALEALSSILDGDADERAPVL